MQENGHKKRVSDYLNLYLKNMVFILLEFS